MTLVFPQWHFFYFIATIHQQTFIIVRLICRVGVMAHLIHSSRSLLSSSSRSRLCHACSFKLSRPTPRTKVTTAIEDVVKQEQTSPGEQVGTDQKAAENKTVQNVNPEWNHSTTWDDLEWVGSRKYIWENAKAPGVKR
jgi:hypothetical protein